MIQCMTACCAALKLHLQDDPADSLFLQAGVRYATKNPYSYVHSNVAGHVTLLEAIRVCVACCAVGKLCEPSRPQMTST